MLHADGTITLQRRDGLQGMAGSHIAGASTQRRYFTLGLDMSRGVDYMPDAQLVDQLMQRLPRSFAIATEAQIPSEYASLALPDRSRHIDVAINYVSAHYFQAVDLPNVLGRVITPAEVHAHEPVIRYQPPLRGSIVRQRSCGAGSSSGVARAWRRRWAVTCCRGGSR